MAKVTAKDGAARNSKISNPSKISSRQGLQCSLALKTKLPTDPVTDH